MPDAGRVLFDNDDVTKVPPHKRNTGMMFQSYALWPHMTVAKNVAFGLEERRVPRAEMEERVSQALSSVHMAPYAERKINQLSGGQQQRVALARALVIRPRCLLLDEPLSNLDAKLRLEMRLEIRRVCKEFGLTAVYVTHDQKEALSISDRMAILDTGKVAQIGSAQEIYRRPKSRLVADFIGETNFIEGKVLSGNNGHTRVETALGVFEGELSDKSWAPSQGETATLSIRPEAWSLSAQESKVNSARGRIGESVYLGEVAQYRFASGDVDLKIFELNPKFVGADTQQLFAHVEPQDVVVLRQ